VQQQGAAAVSIVDDDFLGGDGRGRERALEVAQLVQAKGVRISFSIECRVDEMDEEVIRALRDAGLSHVLVGIESGNDTDIRLFGKHTTKAQVVDAVDLLRRLRLAFSVGFIMFQPLSTEVAIRENLDFLDQLGVGTYDRVVNRLELYPGSPMLGYFRRKGVLLSEERYRMYYEFADPTIAVAHQVFTSALRPFIAIEKMIGRRRFRAAVSDLPSDDETLTQLERLSMTTSRELVACARRCLDSARDVTSAEEIVEDVHADVSRVVDRLAPVVREAVDDECSLKAATGKEVRVDA
jgi:anaerobic magnesium-protoporphyrin IX monomethyl ester cyclase